MIMMITRRTKTPMKALLFILGRVWIVVLFGVGYVVWWI